MSSSGAQPAPQREATEQGEHTPAPTRGLRARRPSRPAILALVSGLALTAVLTATSLAVYHRNERRLLNLRLRELNLVLAASAPSIQTPLASAAALANATAGNPQKFKAFLAPYVGVGRQFGSVSLWPLGAHRLAPIAVVGPRPFLASQPARARLFFTKSTRAGVLNMSSGILGTAAHPAL